MEHSTEILWIEDNSNDEWLATHAFEKHHLSNRLHVVRDGAEALEFIFCTGAYADRVVAKTLATLLTRE